MSDRATDALATISLAGGAAAAGVLALAWQLEKRGAIDRGAAEIVLGAMVSDIGDAEAPSTSKTELIVALQRYFDRLRALRR